jgi:uncharacterized membrane protein
MCIPGVLALAACLAGAAGAATAQEHLMVTGVAADDVLNIRSSPSASATIVGWLPPQGFGIVATGARRTTGSTQWREIVWQDVRGWVAARYVAPERIECGGTEPFWGLTISGGAAVFSSPEGADLTLTAGPWGQAIGRPWPQTVWLNRAGGQGVAVIAAMACSDGMSDTDYPYDMTLILPGGSVYTGCCSTGL